MIDRMCDVVIESHTETSPSLRIDKPFPALLKAARAFDFDAMDTTDHGHIPYVYILVRALDDWKTAVRCLCPRRMPCLNKFQRSAQRAAAPDSRGKARIQVNFKCTKTQPRRRKL
jgi:hypothetical protein